MALHSLLQSAVFRFCCLAAGCGMGMAAEFSGWEALRVIRLEDGAPLARIHDVDADGRDDIVVIKRRQSRIDIVRWLPADQRKPEDEKKAARPNDLPMAPEFGRSEIPLDDLPLDVAFSTAPGDSKPVMTVVCGPPNRVVRYQQDAAGAWKNLGRTDLLPGTLLTALRPLTRATKDGGELLIGCEEGIQVLPLASGARPRWLRPREDVHRREWWLADVDHDGDRDLVELIMREGTSALRWWSEDGILRPPQLLEDRDLKDAVLLAHGARCEVAVLDSRQDSVVRRCSLELGDETPFGTQISLALPARGAPWTGVRIDGKPCVVLFDAEQPRFLVYRLENSGWSQGETFPCIGKVTAMAAIPAQPDTILLRSEDSDELLISSWKDGRLSFPQAWRPEEGDAQAEGERAIVGIGTAADTLWWTQTQGKDLVLWRWQKDDAKPNSVRFAKAAGKANKVRWLGDERLLVQDNLSRGARLVSRKGEDVVDKQPAHLKKFDIDNFRLFADAQSGSRCAVISDGVLQWLGADMQPTDQTLLEDGQHLTDLVLLSDGQCWALESGGKTIHGLERDASGVLRVTASESLTAGLALRYDAVLGLIAISGDQIVRLSRGRPWTMKLLESIDARANAPSGFTESRVHRIEALDCDRDGVDELALCDDVRHQLTLLSSTTDKGEEHFTTLASWSVFEDSTYPYGSGLKPKTPGGEDVSVSEPRQVLAADLDGDRKAELVLMSHDRLLIYLTPIAATQER
jgi:hypothetical protein